MSEKKPAKNLNDAEQEFFHTPGKVGQEASYEDALEWLDRALDTLDYPTSEERRDAMIKARVNMRKPVLESVQKFFKEEQARLEENKSEA